GTATGKTGTPSDQTAGLGLTNTVVVRAVDANWNVVTSATPNVAITSSDSSATIADDNGATNGNMTLVSGTRSLSSFTFKTAGTRTITATDAAAVLTANTSPNVTVNAGAASRLTVQTQPSATATAGVAFTTQPVVRIEDQFGNLRSSDTSTVITAARGTGTGALQGTTTAAA